jgi:hypothetical protein
VRCKLNTKKSGRFEQNKKNMPFNVTWLNAIVQILDSYLMPVMAKTQLINLQVVPAFAVLLRK